MIPIRRLYLAIAEGAAAIVLLLLAAGMISKGCRAQQRAAAARNVFVSQSLGHEAEAADLAREYLEDRTAARSWSISPRFLLAGQAWAQGNLEEAEQLFDYLSQRRGARTRTSALNGLGVIRVKQAQAAPPEERAALWAEARAFFEQARDAEGRRGPEVADTRINLAILDLLQGEGRSGRDGLRAAAELADISRQHLVPLYLGLGLTAESPEAARDWFARVEMLVPAADDPAREVIRRHQGNLAILGLTDQRDFSDLATLNAQADQALGHRAVRDWRENPDQLTTGRRAMAFTIVNSMAIRYALAGAFFAREAAAAAAREDPVGHRRRADEAVQAWQQALNLLDESERLLPGQATAIFRDRLLINHALLDLLRRYPREEYAERRAEIREGFIDLVDKLAIPARARLFTPERVRHLRRFVARLHREQNRLERVHELYAALAEESDDYLLPWNQGILHFRAGRYDEARAAWGEAVRRLEAAREATIAGWREAWQQAAEQGQPWPETADAQLAPGEIADWPGLAGILAVQGGGDVPHPARRLWSLLSDGEKENLRRLAAGNGGDEERAAARYALNTALKGREFYQAEEWAGHAPGAVAAALVELPRDRLGDREVLLLNRLLLEAAFPERLPAVWTRFWAEAYPAAAGDRATLSRMLGSFTRAPVVGAVYPDRARFQDPENVLIWTTVVNRGSPLPLAADGIEVRLDGQPVPFVFGCQRVLARTRVSRSGVHRVEVTARDPLGNEAAAAGEFKADLDPPAISWEQPEAGVEIPAFADFPVAFSVTDDFTDRRGPDSTAGLDPDSLQLQFGREGALGDLVSQGSFATNPALHLQDAQVVRRPDGTLAVSYIQRQSGVRRGGEFVLVVRVADRLGNRAESRLRFTVAERASRRPRPGPTPAATP